MIEYKKVLLSFFVVGFLCVTHQTYAHIRGFSTPKPYDILQIRSMFDTAHCFDVSCFVVASTKTKGFRVCNSDLDTEWRNIVNTLQVYQDYQDGLAALKGADASSQIGSIDQLFNQQDEAARYAFFTPCGDLSLQSLMWSAHWQFANHWFLGAYLPLYHLKLNLKQWVSMQPDSGLFEQALYNQQVNFQQLSDLTIGSWERWGVGDSALLLWWRQRFPQIHSMARSVVVAVRGGVTLPTGRSADLCHIFSPQLGYNGGAGLLAGGNVEVDLGSICHAGVDVELVYLFGVHHIERVRTQADQTDLLFLQKIDTFRDPGLVQQFVIYGGLHDTCNKYEITAAYQYRKQNDDRLFLYHNRFDSFIASDAQSVQEWTVHTINVTGVARYKDLVGTLGYQYNFNGKRSVGVDAIIVSLSYSF